MNLEKGRPMKRTKMDAEASIGKLVKAHTSFIALESKLPISSTVVDNLREKFDQAANRVLSLYDKEMKEITSEVARFLGELDDRQHDEETINEVIELFPNALKQVHSDDFLYPVSCLLLSTHGYSFVPLLAKEGMRRKIFPEEEIGGIYDPSDAIGSEEIMQDFLCMNGAMLLRENLGISPEEYQHQESKKSDRQFQKLKVEAHEENDIKRTMVLRQLVHLGIIQKKNIIDFDMIRHSSSNSTSKKRFEFLLSLCPEGLALRERKSDRGYLPIENHAWSVCKEGFGILLKAGIQHYPKKIGFLFEKNPLSGKRTIEFAMSREGLELTHEDLFQFMHEAIPPTDERPILHDVIRLAPKYFSLFWKYYPDAIYLRDERGRLPLNIALQKTPKWSPMLLSVIGINNPIDRHEKDPVTGLYPFMSAASGKRGDLDVIYYLLRRDRNVWEGFRSFP